MSFIKVVLGFIAGSALGVSLSAATPMETWRQETRKVMPAAARLEKVSDTAWSVRNAEGAVIGRLLLEGDAAGGRKFGFAGFIEVALLLDAHDRVVGVLLGDNVETPRFLDRVVEAGFLRRWNTLPLAAVTEHKVDAVTSATYSSEAIRYGVRRLAAQSQGKTYAETPAETQAEISWIERRAERVAKRRNRLAAAVEELKAQEGDQERLAAAERELRTCEEMARAIEARLQTLKSAEWTDCCR